MKILATIIFAIILSSCVPLPAQNIISVTYERSDNGIGLRYDKQFKKDIRHGVYFSGGYGVYDNFSIGLWEHYKVQTGYARYFRNYAEPNWLVMFTIGLSGHYYEQHTEGFSEIEKRAVFPVSADIGVGFIINKRLLIGWDADFIKGDAVFKLGYRFGLK